MLCDKIEILISETEYISELILTAAIATAAISGASYLINKYLNSIYRLEKLIPKYEVQLSVELDEQKKELLESKLNSYKERLVIAKSKLRLEKLNYIKRTKHLEAHFKKLSENPNTSLTHMNSLRKKIHERNIAISKMGVI
jgi:hypothetical protein